MEPVHRDLSLSYLITYCSATKATNGARLLRRPGLEGEVANIIPDTATKK